MVTTLFRALITPPYTPKTLLGGSWILISGGSK